ncbi:MAG: methyltransferase domain-containing protein [Oscillospiraceae bacterium]
MSEWRAWRNERLWSLAASYDRLTSDVPYAEILAFVQTLLTERGVAPRSVLDLACGTGTMSLLLAQSGYQVIGADMSEEMLTVAYDKASALPDNRPFLCVPGGWS